MKAFQRSELRHLNTALCISLFLSALAISVTAEPLAGAVTVANQEELSSAIAKASPGDVIVMANGTWKDTLVKFQRKGTQEQPITLRAQTPGQVFLTGTSSMEISGDWLVVSGLCFKDGVPSKDYKTAEKVIAMFANHSRLTDCAIMDYPRGYFWVYVDGQSNRVDHCFFKEKTTDAPTLQVRVRQNPNYVQIDHNYFGPRSPGVSGGQTVRIGYSEDSMFLSRALVEYNLFEHCDADIEIIGNESCENAYRFNTFRECVGTLSLRHGDRCLVEGNYFFGGGTTESGGVRVMGRGHVVINNYFENLGGREGGIIALHLGKVNSPLDGYFSPDNALIAFNTFIDNQGPCLNLTAGFEENEGTIPPQNVTIANNLLVGGKQTGRIVEGKPGPGCKWMGNIAFGAKIGLGAADGIALKDAKLVKGTDGLWRPGPDSPARGAASGSFPAVKIDMDGQPRTGVFDCGADQVSNAPILNRPLQLADVGPSWMSAAAGERTAASSAVPGATNSGASAPRTFLVPPAQYEKMRETLKHPTAPWQTISRDALRQEATAEMTQGPWSVMDKDDAQIAPSGNKHDFVSYSEYYWKNDKGELEWRDGQVNPVMISKDIDGLYKMWSAVHILGTAGYVLDEPKFSERAAFLLRHWFLDPAYCMTPHLKYAAGIPGRVVGRTEERVEGRGVGLHRMKELPRVLDAVALLETTSCWTKEDREGFRTWLRTYVKWGTESKLGMDERKAVNNHGVYYVGHMLACALYLGDEALATELIEKDYKEHLMKQIEPDGALPAEYKRAHPFGYTVYTLRGFGWIAELARNKGVDLYAFKGPKGQSLHQAFEALIPFLKGEKQWPEKQPKLQLDVAFDTLRLGALRCDDPYFETYLRTTFPDWAKDYQNILWPPP